MKTKILLLITVSCFLLFSCSKDEEQPTELSTDDVATTTSVDEVSDDILLVVESQSNETSYTGKNSSNNDTFFNNCVTVSTVKNENTWVRTVDFGTSNCALMNGNSVRGKIIITFTNNFNDKTRTINYTFDNFYHNDRLVEGNRTVVKTILENGHPQASISLNLKITNSNGGVTTCEGNRVREFIEGYETPFNFLDNVFSITGSWITTLPNEKVHDVSITSPLIFKMSCPRIVSGVISISQNENNATLDYGTGECDAKATITINGVEYEILLGK